MMLTAAANTTPIEATVTWNEKDTEMLENISDEKVFTQLDDITVKRISVESKDLVQETINIAVPDLLEASRQLSLHAEPEMKPPLSVSVASYEPPDVVTLPMSIPLVHGEQRVPYPSLMSQMSHLSKYKCTTLIREDTNPAPRIIQTDNIPILEPHMSTPIAREQAWSQVSEERLDVIIPRQSVIQKLSRPPC